MKKTRVQKSHATVPLSRDLCVWRYGAYQVMKKKFAKDKEAKQASLRQRMRELKKVLGKTSFPRSNVIVHTIE